jgi:hypothetical protein
VEVQLSADLPRDGLRRDRKSRSEREVAAWLAYGGNDLSLRGRESLEAGRHRPLENYCRDPDTPHPERTLGGVHWALAARTTVTLRGARGPRG